MSFFSELLSGGATGLFKGVGEFAKDLREAITGKSILDANQQAELSIKMAALEAAAISAAAEYDRLQMDNAAAIAKLEAASEDKYVARWRPTVGWVCVLGLFYTFLLKPLLPFFIECGVVIGGLDATKIPVLPEVPMGDLIVLLAGMLGLSGMRSLEKIKGVGKES